MKKTALALTLLAAMLTTACTNDAIEIQYDERHDMTLRVNTEQLYDDFNIKSGVMAQLLSSKSNYQVAIISLAYDQQGELTDSTATYIKTFSQVQQQLSVSHGAATIVTIETLVDPANDYKADAWQIEGADELATLAIKARRSYAYWYEVVGISVQRASVNADQQLTITPDAVGSIVNTKFFNIDQTDNDYAAIYTQNRPSGYRIDPTLPATDRYIYEQYNEQSTWSRRGFESNKGGHLDAEFGFDAYILESGNIKWCITATKVDADNTIRFTAYPTNNSFFNFENGKKYYAGLYYNGSTYQAFLGSQSEYQTWYNQVRGNTPTPTTLYREPYTTWGGTVAGVKSYMSGYTLDTDITYDSDDQDYYMIYQGKDWDAYIQYVFTGRTSGLKDSYVFIDNAKDLATVRANIVAQGYSYVNYDEESESYLYRKGNTGVILYTTSTYHIVNYYDISFYSSSSVKAKAPRRQSPLRRL